MVENVEELGAGLEAHGFSKVEILGQGEIEISEASILKHIPAHVSKLAQRRRNHDGAAVGVTAKQIQRRRGSSRCSSIYGQRLRGASRVRCTGEVWNPNSLLRFEVRGLAVKTPTNRSIGGRADRQWANAGCIGSLVHWPPVLRALHGDNRV